MSKVVDVLNDPILREEALSEEEKWRRDFDYATTSSDEYLQYVPKDHRPYKAIGARNIEKRKKLGYEILQYPIGHKRAGQDIRLTEFNEAYLMACPIKRANFNLKLHTERMERNKVKDMSDVVKNPTTANGSEPMRPLGEREE